MVCYEAKIVSFNRADSDENLRRHGELVFSRHLMEQQKL